MGTGNSAPSRRAVVSRTDNCTVCTKKWRVVEKKEDPKRQQLVALIDQTSCEKMRVDRGTVGQFQCIDDGKRHLPACLPED